MFKDKIEQVKALIKSEGNSKKKIENLAVFIVILIITIIIIKMIWSGDESKNNRNKNTLEDTVLADIEKNTSNTNSLNEKSQLEEKLENILNKMEGVGNVRVMITYSETSKTVAMYNEDIIQNDTEENDNRRGN